MTPLFSQLLPILYGVCFLALLIQAFRVMGQGFRALPRNGRPVSPHPQNDGDRTGKITVHPELLEADGRITEEGLLTVRFSGDNEKPASTGEAG